MNLIDILIIAIIALSLAVGVFRGFIREVLSLASWIVALWAAYSFAGGAADLLVTYIAQPPIRVVVAFAVIFILALIAASLLGYLVYRLLSFGGISGIDRSLGLLFGVARGVVIVGLLVLAAIFMDLSNQTWWLESMLVGYFDPIADALRSLMPENLSGYFQPQADEK